MTSRKHLEQFAGLIAEAFGLDVTGPRLPLLASAVENRMAAVGDANQERYLSRFTQVSTLDPELRLIASLLTIGETSFFRTRPHLDAFVTEALPARLKANPGTVLIMSAGCATGEEPYTLAILVREHVLQSDLQRVRIVALDLDASAIARAREGRYSSWSLRDTPAGLRDRWFRRDGKQFVLDPLVRAMVDFRVANLLAPDPMLWQPASLDIIFCRNVTIYFTPEALHLMAARTARTLAPGGYLFIGHAESMRGVNDDLELHHSHGAFFYRKPVAPHARKSQPLPAINTPPPLRERDAPVALDLDAAIDLLRQERFAAAEVWTRDATMNGDARPRLLLARAIALMNLDDAARSEADALCRRIATDAPTLAEGHMLDGLLREQAGAEDAACRAYRAALAHDATCAVAQLALGRIARQRDNDEAARAAYQAALHLLPGESDARLVMFAGGFSRELLMQLCRSEVERVTDARLVEKT